MLIEKKCKHCKVPIDLVNYGTGSEWVHTPARGHPYTICKPAPVAEPEDKITVGEWKTMLSDTKPIEIRGTEQS